MDLAYELERVADRVYETTSRTEMGLTFAKGSVDGLKSMMESFSSSAQQDHQVDVENFSGELFARLHSDTDRLENAGGWQGRIHDLLSEDSTFKSVHQKFLNDSSMCGLAVSGILSSLDIGLVLDGDNNDQSAGDSSGSDWEQQLMAQLASERMREVSEAKSSVDSMGLLPSNDDSYEEGRVKLVQFFMSHPEAQDAIKKAGRIQRLNKSFKLKSGEGQSVSDIECGGDLTRILPSELALLATEMKMWKMHQILEEKALQYRVEDDTEQERGPIWVLRDISSSMNHMDRNQKAASVCLYAMKESISQKRQIRITNYDISARSEIFKGESQKLTPDQLLSVLETRCSGGTDLGRVIKHRVNGDAYLQNSDLVIITDGYDILDNDAMEVVKSVKELGVRFVLIGIGEAAGFSPSLVEMSDKIVMLSDSEDFVRGCGELGL